MAATKEDQSQAEKKKDAEKPIANGVKKEEELVITDVTETNTFRAKKIRR